MKQIRYVAAKDYPAIDGQCAVKYLGYNWKLDRPYYPHRPEGDRGYFFLLAETELRIREETLLRTHPKHSFIIFAPGTYIHFGHDVPWSHSLMGAGGTYVDELIHELAIPCNEVLLLRDCDIFSECILGCYKEVMHLGDTDREILKSYLSVFLRKLQRALNAPDSRDGGIPGRFVQARRYIDERYRGTISIGALAARYGYSEPYFVSSFTRYFRISPIAYVIRRRMDDAAVGLLNLDLKVGDVAASVGIDSLHYFSRLFKKTYGVSPMEYRRNAFGRGDGG